MSENDEIRVGDRFETTNQSHRGAGHRMTITAVDEDGEGFDLRFDTNNEASSLRGRQFLKTRFRRLPREEAAKPALPRVAKSVEELRPGMRVCAEWNSGGSRTGLLQPDRGRAGRFNVHEDGELIGAHIWTGSWGVFKAITILSEPSGEPKAEAKPAGLKCGDCGGADHSACVIIKGPVEYTLENIAMRPQPQGCDPRCRDGKPCRRPACQMAVGQDGLEREFKVNAEAAQAAEEARILAKYEAERAAPLPTIRPWAMLDAMSTTRPWLRRGR